MSNSDSGSFPSVRQVNANAIIDWLHAGVEDTHRGGWASLFYGFVFTVTGLLINAFFADEYWLLAGLSTGFFLFGPFLAMGLYDLSRRIERGEAPSLIPSLAAWRTNFINISLFALLLLAVLLIWTLLSLTIFSHYFHGAFLSFTDVALNVITLKQPTFTLIYFSVGAVFAVFVYAISVVALPMMLDCKANVATAVVTSLRTCARNPLVMLLWALCIVVLLGVGLAASYIGLFLTMPVVGHASWHVYRGLIETNR